MPLPNDVKIIRQHESDRDSVMTTNKDFINNCSHNKYDYKQKIYKVCSHNNFMVHTEIQKKKN
ncbi:hypothetical protein FJZ19_05280 [Candidatus Pacearchaeota archaeon]|nr:hypothetical protein [Candidatus Pacearchaeota archaeon]